MDEFKISHYDSNILDSLVQIQGDLLSEKTRSKGGISKWQAKDKEETRSIEFYTLENQSEPMENISTSTW